MDGWIFEITHYDEPMFLFQTLRKTSFLEECIYTYITYIYSILTALKESPVSSSSSSSVSVSLCLCLCLSVSAHG